MRIRRRTRPRRQRPLRRRCTRIRRRWSVFRTTPNHRPANRRNPILFIQFILFKSYSIQHIIQFNLRGGGWIGLNGNWFDRPPQPDLFTFNSIYS